MIYNLIQKGLAHTWPTLVIVAIMLITIRVFYHFQHKDKIVLYKDFWILLSIMYLILLYNLVTNVETNTYAGFNIEPFKEILRYKVGSKMFYYNVIGNIGLFVPLGLIASYYVKPKKLWPSIIMGIIISSTIEFVQLNIGRSFDIDDILLNTIGCMIGFLIYFTLNYLKRFFPKFMQSTWFNNLICIIIGILILVYLFDFKGASLGL